MKVFVQLTEAGEKDIRVPCVVRLFALIKTGVGRCQIALLIMQRKRLH